MTENESTNVSELKMAEDNSIQKPELDKKNPENEICITISSDEEENDGNSMDKNTNLHFNAAFGVIENLNLDLESGNQDIDVENFMGWTPLMMACRNGRVDVVKILLDKGADVTRKNKLGVNIFGLAIATGKLDLVEIILRHMLRGGISRNRIQEDLSPISLAILFRKNHLINWLIQQGFDLNAATPKTHLTPLMFAAAVKNEKMITLLESQRAKKPPKNYIGMDYKDISLWSKKGLENLKVLASSMREQKPPFEIDYTANQVFTTTDIGAKTPTESKARVMPPTYKVPNNTPCGVFMQKNTPLPSTYEYYMMQNDMHSPTVGHENRRTSPSDYYSNNCRENIFNFETNNKHLYPNYTQRYNVHYQNCMPVMNSCGLSSPNPVASVTPVMMASPFQNFIATMKGASQNLPMTMIPSPQHAYKSPTVGMQVFLSPQVAMEHQANYLYGNSDPSYDGFEQNEVLYHMVSPTQNMYVFDSLCNSSS